MQARIRHFAGTGRVIGVLCIVALLVAGCKPVTAPDAQSIAVNEGTPVSAEQVQQPVEYVRKIDTSAQQIKNPLSLAVDNQGNVYVTDGSDNPTRAEVRSVTATLYWRGAVEVAVKASLSSYPRTLMPVQMPVLWRRTHKAMCMYRMRTMAAYRSSIRTASSSCSSARWAQRTASSTHRLPGQSMSIAKATSMLAPSPRVQKFDADGNFLASYGVEGDGNGEFTGAALGAIDDAGNMYVADLLNARVQKLDPNGAFLLQWGSSGTEPGQFFMPVAIVQDSAGKLYVADNTDRIQIFDTEGNYLGQWTLDGPTAGLAIDAQGQHLCGR